MRALWLDNLHTRNTDFFAFRIHVYSKKKKGVIDDSELVISGKISGSTCNQSWDFITNARKKKEQVQGLTKQGLKKTTKIQSSTSLMSDRLTQPRLYLQFKTCTKSGFSCISVYICRGERWKNACKRARSFSRCR